MDVKNEFFWSEKKNRAAHPFQELRRVLVAELKNVVFAILL